MKRTTIMLPDKLKNKASRYAEKHGMSLGGLIRFAIEREIKKDPIEEDSFFASKTVFRGNLPTDASTNTDNYIYDE